MGSKTSYKWIDLAPGAEVSEEAERFMRKGILEVYGEEGCTGPLYTTGSDDFHYYTVKRPHLKSCHAWTRCQPTTWITPSVYEVRS